jgi:hypothetical protein
VYSVAGGTIKSTVTGKGAHTCTPRISWHPLPHPLPHPSALPPLLLKLGRKEFPVPQLVPRKGQKVAHWP